MFNKTAVLLADIPVGTRFQLTNSTTVYTKVSPWHVQRKGAKKPRRMSTITMVRAETPDWAK